MEKTRFCYRRCLSIVALGLFAFTLQAAEPKQIEVEVEVPIESGDVAGAAEKAQKAAFRKAVSIALGSRVSDEEKEEKLKSAYNYINSFQKLSQNEEGGMLKVSFRCEVVLSEGESASSARLNEGDYFLENFAVEFNWNPGSKAVLAAEIKQVAEEDLRSKVDVMKLQHGGLWVEMRSRMSPERVFIGLQRRFGKNSEMRLVRDLRGLILEESDNQQSREN